jgi:adenosylcobinamide kinase/adenosylcobinamide-phosphate guanylyltransferase
MMKTLILGGVRSGKSRIAEQLAMQLTAKSTHLKQDPLVYIATSFPYDAEMQQRVDEHQAQRQQSSYSWTTIEESLYLAKVLDEYSAPDTTILVDCLTLWMTNLLCHEDKQLLQQETQALLQQLDHCRGNLIFVSNETGLGIVPMKKLSRQFVDQMGLFHQQLAQICDTVSFVVAGLSLPLKPVPEV